LSRKTRAKRENGRSVAGGRPTREKREIFDEERRSPFRIKERRKREKGEIERREE